MYEVALCLRAANRQAVLARTVTIGHRLGVSIVSVRVPASIDERELADLHLRVTGTHAALDNLIRRLCRVVDVASVKAETSLIGQSDVEALSCPGP